MVFQSKLETIYWIELVSQIDIHLAFFQNLFLNFVCQSETIFMEH